jgi:hypothetical protein
MRGLLVSVPVAFHEGVGVAGAFLTRTRTFFWKKG